METKLSKLVAAAQAGDWSLALRIAARFQDLGAQRDAIKRAHEVQSNPAFYQQLGFDPEALMAAGIEALKTRYRKQLATLIEGTDEMSSTNLTAIEIAKLTAVMTGGGYKRANSKEAAIKRFLNVAAEKGIADADKTLGAGYDFATAEHVLFERLKGGHASIAEVHAATPAEEAAPAKARKPKAAPVARVSVDQLFSGDALGMKAARKAKAAPAPKPEGKRAAIIAAAERGEMPDAPDFSAETHKRFRAKLAQVVALAEAGDLAGLKAVEINPVSTSPRAIARYRDLAVTAIKARAAQGKAA